MIPDKQITLLLHPIFSFQRLFHLYPPHPAELLEYQYFEAVQVHLTVHQYVWPQLGRQTDWLTFEAVGVYTSLETHVSFWNAVAWCSFQELIRVVEGKPPLWKAVNCCQRVFGLGSPQHNYSCECVYSMTHFGTFVFRVLNINLWNFECVCVVMIYDSYLEQRRGT